MMLGSRLRESQSRQTESFKVYLVLRSTTPTIYALYTSKKESTMGANQSSINTNTNPVDRFDRTRQSSITPTTDYDRSPSPIDIHRRRRSSVGSIDEDERSESLSPRRHQSPLQWFQERHQELQRQQTRKNGPGHVEFWEVQ
ncbi:hypothetical protein EX30DRAFT_5100 [Ascodesmis nigricans]|uniref:Uncharacterized protein n=1 Tax=Ascodesmis nigricans TaxID=341454 RepID=A0A4S2N5X4_9PEZI|nr:hypothetical protein EX30DRAFT_5100 [Ascodesmis nigricans]